MCSFGYKYTKNVFAAGVVTLTCGALQIIPAGFEEVAFGKGKGERLGMKVSEAGRKGET